MTNQSVSNPNDFKVVSFHNSTDLDFTPDMGCMYDGRVINGPKGGPGIKSGEIMTLPYHIGHRLAINLAKIVMIRGAGEKPQVDAQGNPMIKSLWDDKGLENLKNTYITDLYSEDKPAAPSQTDVLMDKVEALNKMVQSLVGNKTEVPVQPPVDNDHVAPGATQFEAPNGMTYQDKAEVIAELEKRGTPHDKRKSKAELEKLIV